MNEEEAPVPTALSFATTDEIIEELDRRTGAMIVAFCRKDGSNPIKCRYYYSGLVPLVAGLHRVASAHVDKMIAKLGTGEED